jgi:hypothetical protein
LELFLKGLSVEVQEETDLGLVDGMRIALLDAFDIQRARDHGLPDYNTLREAYGLPRVASFAAITSNIAAQNAMAAVYPDINTIDPLVGALAEDHLPGASVGPLVAAGYRVQFERLRDGDRFWYEHDGDFSPVEVAELRQTRLSDVIRRNTKLANLQSDVFFAVPEPGWAAMIASLLALIMSRGRAPICAGKRYRRKIAARHGACLRFRFTGLTEDLDNIAVIVGPDDRRPAAGGVGQWAPKGMFIEKVIGAAKKDPHRELAGRRVVRFGDDDPRF